MTISDVWDFVDGLPVLIPIDNMFTFLLITVSVSVIGSIILMTPAGRNQ